jgi:hypothetical protein
MQCGQGCVSGPGEYREVHEIGVEVQNVVPAGEPLHLLQHHHVVWDVVPDIRVKPQGLAARRHQICAGSGVAAGKQGDLVSLPYEFVCQVRGAARFR